MEESMGAESAETAAKKERPRRANDLGPIGEHVADNVLRLRKSLPMTTEQLAAEVSALGRPMRANTITKIEKGQRRVDVDDLVALSLALRARPDALLLPSTLVGNVQLSTERTVSAVAAWSWANGLVPLDLPKDDDGRAYNAFQTRAQPPGMGLFKSPYPPPEYQPLISSSQEGDVGGEHPEATER